MANDKDANKGLRDFTRSNVSPVFAAAADEPYTCDQGNYVSDIFREKLRMLAEEIKKPLPLPLVIAAIKQAADFPENIDDVCSSPDPEKDALFPAISDSLVGCAADIKLNKEYTGHNPTKKQVLEIISNLPPDIIDKA